MPVRLIIADDHSMVRQSLGMYFESDPEVDIVAEARDGREAVALTERFHPDVVLMDLLMPGMNGMQATAAIRKTMPDVEVVAMTSVMEDAAVPEAINAGAIAYVLKDTRPEELRRAILAASKGQVVFASETVERLTSGMYTSAVDPAALSPEQVLLLTHIARGHCNEEIARLMDKPGEEARRSVQALLEVLQVAGRAQAVLYAVTHQLVPVSEVPALTSSTSPDPSPML
jgi:two-component system, NarL family, response regulator LiaR